MHFVRDGGQRCLEGWRSFDLIPPPPLNLGVSRRLVFSDVSNVLYMTYLRYIFRDVTPPTDPPAAPRSFLTCAEYIYSMLYSKTYDN